MNMPEEPRSPGDATREGGPVPAAVAQTDRTPATQLPRAVAQPVGASVRKVALTTWEGIWYVLMNIWFAAGYLTKVPAKKALQDFGLCEMTSAERFWYVLMCVWFGAGYLAKIPTAKALSELPQYRGRRKAMLDTLS